ncbi:MAG: ABC transporter ATP-binding protein [Cytophagales bacterium]
MIEIYNIEKSYKHLKVLNNVSLEVKRGEITTIVGASGAGKSTLLQIIGTLDKPDSGKVIFNGTDIFSLNEQELCEFRNKKLGFIFQFHNLLPEFSALENVCIPAYIAKKSKKEAEEKAKELLEQLGLSHRLHHKPSELSGGEQQRTAVARALVNDPDLILADEPSGNLDSKNAHELHKLFFELKEKMNKTFVVVTHNEELAKIADKTFEMRDGSLVLELYD